MTRPTHIARIATDDDDDPFSGGDHAERYFNRELSWLAFNRRVLEEASNAAHPLLERLRFLSISGSNIDEFFMVRVAGLQAQTQRTIAEVPPDGATPHEQLVAISLRAHAIVDSAYRLWNTEIIPALRRVGIVIVRPDELAPAELGAQHRVEARMRIGTRVGRLDGAVGQLRQDRFHRGTLAAPPGGQGRQAQLLADQVLCQRGQEAQHGRRFEHAQAERVRDEHVAGTPRLYQSRHAERRIRAQLHGIRIIVVEPPPDGVDRPQAGDGLEKDAIVTDGEVTAFDERHAELTREIDVLEVGLAEPARRQQHEQRRTALAGGR